MVNVSWPDRRFGRVWSTSYDLGMGLTDPRGVRAPNAIAGALQAGGQLRVVLGADGALKAESDAPPITLPETGAST
jgi:hypothetical protein